jgi:hypothetical protein
MLSERWPVSTDAIVLAPSKVVPMKPVSAARRAEIVAIDAPRLYTAAPIATDGWSLAKRSGVTMNEPVSVAVFTNAGNGERPTPGTVGAQ